MNVSGNVRWSDEEWELLADWCIALRVNDPVSSLLALAKQAVLRFPKTRQRVLTSQAQIEPLAPYVRRKLATVLPAIQGTPREITYEEARSKFGDRILAEATPTETPKPAPSVEDLYLCHGAELLKPFDVPEVIEYFGIETLIERVDTPQLIGLAVERVCRNLGGMSNPLAFLQMPPVPSRNGHAEHKPSPPKEPETLPKWVPKKSSILVVGALPDHKQHLASSRLSGRCKFRFVDSDAGKSVDVGSPDVIVAWSSFINHSTRDRIKTQCGDIPLIEHSGGVTKLIDAIERKLDALPVA